MQTEEKFHPKHFDDFIFHRYHNFFIAATWKCHKNLLKHDRINKQSHQSQTSSKIQRTHTDASIPPNSSKMSHLAISLNVEPSRIFCMIAALSLRALLLIREHVASAYFGRGGTTFGDLYWEGNASDGADGMLKVGDKNPTGDGKEATKPAGDANDADADGGVQAGKSECHAEGGLEKHISEDAIGAFHSESCERVGRKHAHNSKCQTARQIPPLQQVRRNSRQQPLRHKLNQKSDF